MVNEAIAKARAQVRVGDDNVAFHMRLAEIAGNPILVMVLASIMDLLTLIIRRVAPGPEVSRAVAEEHVRIIDAIEARDGQRLRALIEEHIRTANARLERLAPGEG